MILEKIFFTFMAIPLIGILIYTIIEPEESFLFGRRRLLGNSAKLTPMGILYQRIMASTFLIATLVILTLLWTLK